MKKKRLILFGTFLGFLGLGVINASLYWDSGYASKKISLSENSEDETDEAFDLAAGSSSLFLASGVGRSSSNANTMPSVYVTLLSPQQEKPVAKPVAKPMANKDEFAPKESVWQVLDVTSVSTGGGMTQQGGSRSSYSMSAGTSSNSGSYRGGYTRHVDDNGVWNSLKPTSSASQYSGGSDSGKEGDSDSSPDPEVNPNDEGRPTSVPDSGATVWMLGLSLFVLRFFVTRNRSTHL